jgi:hypothetical protein
MSKELKLLQQEVASIKALITNILYQQEEEVWLDATDVKTLFHFSDSKLYRLRKENVMPFVKIGGRFHYPKSYFNTLLVEKYSGKES